MLKPQNVYFIPIESISICTFTLPFVIQTSFILFTNQHVPIRLAVDRTVPRSAIYKDLCIFGIHLNIISMNFPKAKKKYVCFRYPDRP